MNINLMKIMKKIAFLFLVTFLTVAQGLSDVSAFSDTRLAVATPTPIQAPLHNLDAGTVYENRIQERQELPDVLKNKSTEIDENYEKTQTGYVQNDNIIFDVEKVIFEGNTAISTKKLQEFAQREIVRRDVSLTQVGEFVSKISKMYHEQGYITSFAFLPPQTIQNKTIKVKILEGKVGDVTIAGNKFSSENFIRYQMLKPYYMEAGQILNINDIRQGLIELNERGYISGTISLAKGKKTGSTDLNLNVKEHQPFSISINADNAGRDTIGKERLSAFISNNNLTGHGDILSVGGAIAENSFSVSPQYSIPISNRGDLFYASYGFSKVTPGQNMKFIDLVGKAHIYSFGFKNPIHRSRNLKVDLNTSLNFKDGEFYSKIPVVNYRTDYSVRTLETALSAIQKDKTGRTYFNVGANIGLPCMGGADDSKFVVFNGGVTRQFWLPSMGVAILRFNGQVTPDSSIPSIEQFQVGGFNSVRGYDEGLMLGKTGFTGGVQVNTAIPFLPDSIPVWKKGDNIYRLPIKERLKLVGFYDFGYSKNPYTNAEFIQSIGTGVRVYLTKYLTASVDFGFPIGERPEGAHRFRTHFFLTSNIL